MGLTPDEIFATPDQHFLAFDGGDALFLPMDREAYRRSIFLDRRIAALADQPARMAMAPLIDAAQGRILSRTGWIFHVAHCGSTLLSRLIDVPGSGLVLREPPPLRQLGIAKASGNAGPAWDSRLRLAAAMAARRYDPQLPTVVKANVPVNFMLDALLALDPEAPAIMLHFALEPYLLAVLGSEQHRIWVDRITGAWSPELAASVGLSQNAATPERAAALWLAQMIRFDAAIRDFPGANSLDAEVLFAAPAATVEAAAVHLGLGKVDIEESAAELGSTYAKDPSRPFGEAERKARQQERGAALQGDIAAARRWLDASPVRARLPDRLERPLIGESPALLS